MLNRYLPKGPVAARVARPRARVTAHCRRQPSPSAGFTRPRAVAAPAWRCGPTSAGFTIPYPVLSRASIARPPLNLPFIRGEKGARSPYYAKGTGTSSWLVLRRQGPITPRPGNSPGSFHNGPGRPLVCLSNGRNPSPLTAWARGGTAAFHRVVVTRDGGGDAVLVCCCFHGHTFFPAAGRVRGCPHSSARRCLLLTLLFVIHVLDIVKLI